VDGQLAPTKTRDLVQPHPVPPPPRGGDPTALTLRTLHAARRFWWLVALMVALAAASALALSFLQPTRYEATTSLILTDATAVGVPEAARISVDRGQQVEVVQSQRVAKAAAERLGEQVTPEQVMARVTASTGQRSIAIDVTAAHATPQGAASTADAVARAYREVTSAQAQQRIESTITHLEQQRTETKQRIRELQAELPDDRAPAGDTVAEAEVRAAISRLTSLDQRIQQLTTNAALFGSVVDAVEPAEPPAEPAQPRPVRNAGLGALLGLAAALGVALWRDERTRSVEGEQEPLALVGAPLLGVVPDHGAKEANEGPAIEAAGTRPAESYQFVVASMEIALRDHSGGSTVAIISATPREGKTQVALNLAVAALGSGREVLLVDADERKGALTDLSPCAPEPGLTNIGQPAVPLTGCVAGWPTGSATLPFVPAGQPSADPAAFFRSVAFREAFAELRGRADMMVVDTPPLLAVADTSELADQVDGLVVVVERGTPVRALQELGRRLAFVGTPVLGYVFNRASSRWGHGYSYDYGYYGSNGSVPGGASSDNGHRPRPAHDRRRPREARPAQ
jgi:Mrp family chromosome partitioning ATPase